MQKAMNQKTCHWTAQIIVIMYIITSTHL